MTSLPPAISAPDQLPGVLRDWKEHGVSCPLALPGDHTVPHLSEQKRSTVRAESVVRSVLAMLTCKPMWGMDLTHLPVMMAPIH